MKRRSFQIGHCWLPGFGDEVPRTSRQAQSRPRQEGSNRSGDAKWRSRSRLAEKFFFPIMAKALAKECWTSKIFVAHDPIALLRNEQPTLASHHCTSESLKLIAIPVLHECPCSMFDPEDLCQFALARHFPSGLRSIHACIYL